jgi:hypothetical protein
MACNGRRRSRKAGILIRVRTSLGDPPESNRTPPPLLLGAGGGAVVPRGIARYL